MMSDIASFCRNKHLASVIPLAVVVGFIFVSPHFYMSKILDEKGLQYNPIIGQDFDEREYYHPRAAAAYWGDRFVGDISIFEYKDGPTTLAILNPLHIGILGRLIGSFENGLMLADFIFPALIFIALYFIFQEIVDKKYLSLFFALVFIFSPLFAMNFPPTSLSALKELLGSFFPLSTENSFFSRWEYPLATYFFYALALSLIFRAVKFNGRKNIFAAGVSTGVIFYSYFYDWVYILISLFILFWLYLLNQKKEEAMVVFQIALIASFVSIYYWINYLRLHNLPQFDDIVSRMGVEMSRQFRLASVWKSYLRIIFLDSLLMIFIRKKHELSTYFITAFLSAYLVAVNIQVVLGFNPQPDHWYRELFLITALGWALIVSSMSGKYGTWAVAHKKPLAASLGIFVAIFLIMQARNKYVYSATNADSFVYPQYIGAYRWLNENTPENSVVGSFWSNTNTDILLYAHNKVFLPSGFVTLASTEEIWERTMIMSKVFGVSSEEFIEIVKKNNYYLFTEKYRDNSFDKYFLPSTQYYIADEAMRRVSLYEALNIKSEPISRYKLDYLIFGIDEARFGVDPNVQLPNLRKVYHDQHAIIYEI